VPDITREELAEVHGLSSEEILKLDHEAQHILGKSIMLIDFALRDEAESCQDKIETALTFIETAMKLIEQNFESMVESKIPNTQLN
jgi:hypothetical protein